MQDDTRSREQNISQELLLIHETNPELSTPRMFRQFCRVYSDIYKLKVGVHMPRDSPPPPPTLLLHALVGGAAWAARCTRIPPPPTHTYVGGGGCTMRCVRCARTVRKVGYFP